MKKLVIALILIAMVMPVWANGDETDTGTTETPPSSLIISATVDGGSDIITPGGEDNEGLRVWVTYTTTQPTGSETYSTEIDLAGGKTLSNVKVSSGDTVNTITSVYLEVWGAAQVSKLKSTTVSFSCDAGLVNQSNKSVNIPVTFSGAGAFEASPARGSELKAAIPTENNDNKSIEVTAKQGTPVLTATPLAYTIASWTPGVYEAGSYEGTITVTFTEK